MHPSRARTPTSFYTVPAKQSHGKGDFAVETGPGRPLGELESLSHALNGMKAADGFLQQLHLLLFGTLGTQSQRKKHIRCPRVSPLPSHNRRLFSGFPSAAVIEDKKSKLREKRKFWTLDELKKALSVLDQPTSGHRDDLVDRLVDFLACPVEIPSPSCSLTHDRPRKNQGRGCVSSFSQSHSGSSFYVEERRSFVGAQETQVSPAQRGGGAQADRRGML